MGQFVKNRLERKSEISKGSREQITETQQVHLYNLLLIL